MIKKYLTRFILRLAADLRSAEDRDKLSFAFATKKHKYYRYLNDMDIPPTRYEQGQIALQEIEARISRKDILLWCDSMSALLEKQNRKYAVEQIGHMIGELRDRINFLFEPEIMMRFLTGMYIREDQIGKEHIWNQSLEDSKYEEVMSELSESGGVADFFQKNGLSNHLPSTALSITELEEMIQKQTQLTSKWRRMVRLVSSERKSTTGRKPNVNTK